MGIDEALWRLTQAGVPAASPDNLIARSAIVRAEIALGLRGDAGLDRNRPEVASASGPIPSTVVSPPKPRDGVERDPVEVVGQVATDLVYMDAATVLGIHFKLVEDFARSADPIEPAGTRDRGELLESAVGRPHTSLGGLLKYPTTPMAGAALLGALIQDHPFVNGNKRTAIVSLLVFLDMNDHVLIAEEDDLFDHAFALAQHDIADSTLGDAEMLASARWILRHSRPIRREERRIRWRDLRRVLAEHGCSFEQRAGNSIAIRRGQYLAVAGARNDGDELDRTVVRWIRGELHLAERDGVDSLAFYNGDEAIPEFINRYRRTLERLAKY
ncbi:MAG: type II toxin-antitoxin system death-on-curing family toxin [Dehalococcoidia bacterium]|nr:type II toxin-antitoxin system death-on-curing family toxin [Dehalococcoidia bacterium]